MVENGNDTTRKENKMNWKLLYLASIAEALQTLFITIGIILLVSSVIYVLAYSDLHKDIEASILIPLATFGMLFVLTGALIPNEKFIYSYIAVNAIEKGIDPETEKEIKKIPLNVLKATNGFLEDIINENKAEKE